MIYLYQPIMPYSRHCQQDTGWKWRKFVCVGSGFTKGHNQIQWYVPDCTASALSLTHIHSWPYYYKPDRHLRWSIYRHWYVGNAVVIFKMATHTSIQVLKTRFVSLNENQATSDRWGESHIYVYRWDRIRVFYCGGLVVVFVVRCCSVVPPRTKYSGIVWLFTHE